MCGWLDVGCKFKEVVGDAVDNAVTQWALAVLESASNALLKLSTAWVGVSVPDLTVSDSTVGFVHDTTHLLVIALAIGSLIVAGIQLAISRKGDGALQILQGLLTLALVSAVSVGTAQLLVEASDEFSVWVLDLAMPEGTEDFAQSILQFGDLSAGLGYVVLIVLGLAAMIATVIQIGLMFIRSSMLILLVGILPLAGAAYFTKWGRAWLWKLIAWFFAFLMFKPAASIIYAVAIKLLTGETWSEVSGDELIRFITGVVMLVLAVLALPALITFMVPATEVLSNGGSGAGVGAGAVLATGAMTVARGAGAAASGGTAAAAGAAVDAAQGAANSAVGGGSSSGGDSSSPGASGPAGAGGQDGASGTDGAAGPSGASGQDGASGADGSASTPAPSGASDAADTGGGSSGGPSGGQEAQR